MVSMLMQRDRVVALKKEIYLNVGILSKLHPMQVELSRQIFKSNPLEKPTQNLFNHLSYYFVCIIDSKASTTLPWPLYDTKTERTYRNQLSNFINDYGTKGLLSPVMSSYFVNPGCYKVIVLMFQMSQLAVQRMLLSKMKKPCQKQLYDSMTQKYKQNINDFMEKVQAETAIMLSKLSNYLHKRTVMHKIAEMFCNQIAHMEAKLNSLNTQKFINDLIDGYLKTCTIDEEMKSEVIKIKDINSGSKFFDLWLVEVDEKINKLETEWTEKTSPFLKTCQQTRIRTEELTARQTGAVDRSTYTIEYNPNTDEICTKELEDQVNSQQKYILKNIVKGKTLNFPNLIRGFIISISFILKNAEISGEIYMFNEYLDEVRRSYNEANSSMRLLVERVVSAEARLKPSSIPNHEFLSIKELKEIPPLPDLSDLKATREVHSQLFFDTFTPFGVSKHQFNLHRKQVYGTNQPKSLLTVPFCQPPRDNFLKSLISYRASSYDRANMSNLHNNNISIIPHSASRPNETIAECSGFTKQQILRLLSTKKSSSSKKLKYNTERPAINVKKGGLFNESNCPNESKGLYRSHSSPNLFENRDKKCPTRLTKRKLSIMEEDTSTLLEVSGIAILGKDNSYVTPEAIKTEHFRKPKADVTNMPHIMITPDSENKINKILKDIETDLNKDVEVDTAYTILKNSHVDSKTAEINKQHAMNSSVIINTDELKVNTVLDLNIKTESDTPHMVLEKEKKEVIKEDSKTETPKMNTHLVRKTSSLEKIINRFKKVRASVLPDTNNENTNEFKAIVEEKENFNSVNLDVFTANRLLLPDLLSPSCSVVTVKSDLDQLCLDMDEIAHRKPRESLSTVLGVDQTFLDQFDLID